MQMKQLKVGWRQQHVARAKGVPDAHEPFRETFGMSEDEDESEDEDAERSYHVLPYMACAATSAMHCAMPGVLSYCTDHVARCSPLQL